MFICVYMLNLYKNISMLLPSRLLYMMLGTFTKDFSQVATSQGYFPQGQHPKSAISQAETSQVCSSRSSWPKPVLTAALSPRAHRSCSTRPPLQRAAPQEGLT